MKEEKVTFPPLTMRLDPDTFTGSTTILFKQIINSLETYCAEGFTVVDHDGNPQYVLLDQLHAQLVKGVVESCLEIVLAESDGRVRNIATAGTIARRLVLIAGSILHQDGSDTDD